MSAVSAIEAQVETVSTGEMANEQWREIPGYPAYEVSNLGRVRRRNSVRGWGAGHILKPAAARGGHLYVILSDGRSARKQYVHRLVALAFIGPEPHLGAFVLHRDDIPTNNSPGNLYWGTHAQNVEDAKLNRKLPAAPRRRGAQPGEANAAAVLSEQQVKRIKGLLGIGLCGACIARLHGVRKETIYAIAKGRIWAHVAEEASPWIE